VRASRLAGLVASAAAALVGFAGPAGAVVPQSPVPLPKTVESFAPYQPQIYCDPTVKPGTQALADLLTSTYAGTQIVSTVRPCGTDTSEHYDGRAIDWGVDHRIDKQRRQGKAFLSWLFATDGHGNPYAMARRLGVMYVIWNKQIWGSWDQTWEPYACAGDATSCHIDHMHISLDWSGAMQQTSFWDGQVADPIAAPVYTIRHRNAPQHFTVDVQDAAPAPIFRVVGGGKYRFTVSGTYHYDGTAGHLADAECSAKDGSTFHDVAPGETLESAGGLDLAVNGSHRWSPTGTAANGCSAGHTYSRTITFADRQKLLPVIQDADRTESSGSLSVTVERVG
jgi:hypothetical protein